MLKKNSQNFHFEKFCEFSTSNIFQNSYLKIIFFCSIVLLFHGPHPNRPYLRKIFKKNIFFNFFFQIFFSNFFLIYILLPLFHAPHPNRPYLRKKKVKKFFFPKTWAKMGKKSRKLGHFPSL